MLSQGFTPDFPPEVMAEAAAVVPPPAPGGGIRDLRALPWSSIDNRESRDLDQVEVVVETAGALPRVLVGIADVDARVPRGSASDLHARANTTSVYTAVRVFPMLPEAFSTDATSLNEGVDRLALVTEYEVQGDGSLGARDVYRALVTNHARLSYEDVGAWLEGSGPEPPGAAGNAAVLAQVRRQDELATLLRTQRHERGALELETIEPKAISDNGRLVDLRLVAKNRARDLIEDFMVAANTAMAEFLEAHGFPEIERVVHAPERWDRLVDLAARSGDTLPPEPDSRALAGFLRRRRAQDPAHFADVSLAVVKMLGPGEYVVERPGEEVGGHFGLAAQDYTHSTAPNRRYADLVTQRLVKAAIAGQPCPYSQDELEGVARDCTLRENGARKVERIARKQAAALLLAPRAGERFPAIVTGVSRSGTYARLLRPPAEGRVVRGEKGLDVGDNVTVRLMHTDPLHGFIDFAAEGRR